MYIKDNIFKNVYFGQMWKTRDGRKALFLNKEYTDEGELDLYTFDIQGDLSQKSFACNGRLVEFNNMVFKYRMSLNETPSDIISPWDEEVQKMAKEYEEEYYGYSVDLENIINTDSSKQQNIIDVHNAFLAGFDKHRKLCNTIL